MSIVTLATLIHPVTNNAVCRKKPAGANIEAPTKRPTESVSVSSYLPNLLTSDGQVKLFPYNSNETSAQSELIHIMGRSVIGKINKTKPLPLFPKNVQSYSQFSGPPLPRRYYKTRRMSYILILSWYRVLIYKLTNKWCTGTDHMRIHKPSNFFNIGKKGQHQNKAPAVAKSSSTTVYLSSEMQANLNFLQITDTQLKCFVAPPSNYVLNMADVITNN